MLHHRHMSFDEFVRVINAAPSEVNRDNKYNDPWGAARGSRADWFGGARSMEEITGLLESGWNDGADKLANLVRTLPEMPAARSRKRKPTWADNGDELSLDRALAGQWDTAWRTTTRVDARSPVTVDLVALCGGLRSRTAEELFWSGASAVVICDMLEGAGYSVRVLGMSIAQCERGDIAAVGVTLKDTHETMRPDIVASVMCHSGVFRTHMFKARLTLPAYVGHGMGATRGWNDYGIEDECRKAGIIEDGAILLPHTYDREACIDQVKRVIARMDKGDAYGI